MNLLEPIWSQEKPNDSQIEQMWNELEITPESFEHPALDHVLRHLRETHTNGGALFSLFRISDHSTFHWFGSRNRLSEMDFFRRFLTSSVVVSALPELQIDEQDFSEPCFQWGNSLTLDGEIAFLIASGGAYGRFEGTSRDAKNLGVRFCDALFDDRFIEVQVHASHQPWSPWFHGIAWDSTWLGLDKRFSKVWMLCTTDTD
jgi:hypothetical protein